METTIDPFDPPFDSDKIPCGSGTSSCVLDSQGNAHVVFSRMVKLYSGDTLYYYPFSDGLIYWNESMPVLDTTLVSSYTLEFLNAAGNLCGYVMSSQPTYTIPSGQPNYSNAMCAYPQLSIDASDKIFVVSSTLAPDYSTGEFLYRHIIANSSFNLGNSWEGQIDLNADIQYIFSECAYPAMAPAIGDYVHVLFQEDPIPGINQWLTNHEPVENHMMHMVLDKDVFVGLKEPADALPFALFIFPNPVTSTICLNLTFKKAGDLSVKLLNQVGQCVYANEAGRYDDGRHSIRLDIPELSPGIYYCVVKHNGNQITEKVIVMK
jgi:hypothetical protein